MTVHLFAELNQSLHEIAASDLHLTCYCLLPHGQRTRFGGVRAHLAC